MNIIIIIFNNKTTTYTFPLSFIFQNTNLVGDFLVDDNEEKIVNYRKKRDATIDSSLWNIYKDADGNNVIPYFYHESIG